jgi:hypothetical protein
MEFAKKAGAFYLANGGRADTLMDMATRDIDGWSHFLFENKVRGRNPVVDIQGNLDFMAACLAEGLELSHVWSSVSHWSPDLLQKDFASNGLHGLHFRMRLPDQDARIKYTLELAFALYKIRPSEFRGIHSPLIALSTLSGNQEVEQGYLKDSRNHPQLGFRDAKLLCSGDRKNNPDEFKQTLRVLLCTGYSDLSVIRRKDLAERVQEAFLPLVYNFGYRLKASGASNEAILEEASATIDLLLECLALAPETQSALRRQVLINLFSAFPDGLALLKTKPEELQGVMLDPALIDTEVAQLFADTLGGPVHLFSNFSVTAPIIRYTQIIDFFDKTEYPLNFDIASRGVLLKGFSIMQLYNHSNPDGYSATLENSLTGVGPFVRINDPFLIYMMRPERLTRYSDQALLKLIAQTLDHFGKQKPIQGIDTMTMGFHSIGQVFKDRPQLCEPVLELITEKSLLKPKVFDWCGFGARELKSFGKRAPLELKKHVLENSLGL